MKIKNYFSLVLLIIFVGLLSIGFAACDDKSKYKETPIIYVENIDDYEFELSEDGESYIITGYHGLDENIQIPLKFEEKPVSVIGERAFFECFKLKNVLIGNGVIGIGKYAFYNCSGIISILMPNSLTYIDTSAFFCCENLINITIPENVSSVGDYAFYLCDGLTSVNWNAKSCSYSYKPIFEKCSKLTTITVGENVEIIPEYAFWGCSELSNINWNAINCMTKGSYMNPIFEKCPKLTTVNIGEKVETIPEYAFYKCDALTNITIPKSVTNIGDCAFLNCLNIRNLYINDIENWCNISFGDEYSNPMRYSTNVYIDGKLLTDIVIPDSITTIKNYTFMGVISLTSVVIPDSVTTIGSAAFSLCINLTGVKIGNGVTTIGSAAFSSCCSLANILIPNSVLNIENGSFEGCNNLTNVIMPSSVMNINNYAFSFTSLAEITFIGTKSQWNGISRGVYWYGTNPKTCIVHCVDGDIKMYESK